MVSDIINEVKKHFGEMSIVRGNKHAFLETNIAIKDSTVQVDMVKQLEECIEMLGEDVSTSVTSPATNKLFKMREDSKQLSNNN